MNCNLAISGNLIHPQLQRRTGNLRAAGAGWQARQIKLNKRRLAVTNRKVVACAKVPVGRGAADVGIAKNRPFHRKCIHCYRCACDQHATEQRFLKT
jgi:hypothetical protein